MGVLGLFGALRGWLLEGILYWKLAFCIGHPKGDQPVPHTGFENQRCPGAVRRYLGVSGAALPDRFGGFRESGPELRIYVFNSFQKPATIGLSTLRIFWRSTNGPWR